MMKACLMRGTPSSLEGAPLAGRDIHDAGTSTVSATRNRHHLPPTVTRSPRTARVPASGARLGLMACANSDYACEIVKKGAAEQAAEQSHALVEVGHGVRLFGGLLGGTE